MGIANAPVNSRRKVNWYSNHQPMKAQTSTPPTTPQKKGPGRPRTPDSKVLASVLDKHKSRVTWQRFRDARGKPTHKDRARALQDDLTRHLPLRLIRRGCCLNVHSVLVELHQLLVRDKQLVAGPQLVVGVFMDGCQAYPPQHHEVHSVSVWFPQASHPHTQHKHVACARWMGDNDRGRKWEAMTETGLVPLLRQYKADTGARFVWSPDWAELVVMCQISPPNAKHNTCYCCPLPKETYRQARQPGGVPEKVLSEFDTFFGDWWALFDNVLDIVYDVLHCCALVAGHMVVHALVWWFGQFCPAAAVARLHTVLRVHTAWRKATASPKPEHKEWALSGKEVTALLKNNLFWEELRCVVRGCGQPPSVVDGLCRYLSEMRRLMQQLLCRDPQGVATRDADCARVHSLYQSLLLPLGRVTVPCHYFFCHYQARLERHGELVSVSSQGGEHKHQELKDSVGQRPADPKWKCPQALTESLKAEAVQLALWRNGLLDEPQQ